MSDDPLLRGWLTESPVRSLFHTCSWGTLYCLVLVKIPLIDQGEIERSRCDAWWRFNLYTWSELWLAPFPLVFCALTFSCWFPIPKLGCTALNERWWWSICVLCRFLSTPPGLICGHMQNSGAESGLDCASFGTCQSFTHPPRWNHFVVFVWTTIVKVLFISTDSISINQSINKTRHTSLRSGVFNCKYKLFFFTVESAQHIL